MRKAGQGASATAPSAFLFAFLQEGVASLQIEEKAGKSMVKFGLTEENLVRGGVKSGEMRTSASRNAEKKSVYCGKRRALLRKTDGIFTEI